MNTPLEVLLPNCPDYVVPDASGLDFETRDHVGHILPAADSGEHLQAVLLDDGEELDGHAAGLFYAALPHLHGGLAGVEGAGKDGLADALALANPLDTSGIINTGARSSQRRAGGGLGPGLAGGKNADFRGTKSRPCPDLVQTWTKKSRLKCFRS